VSATRLHIAFSESFAGSLIKALKQADRDDRVVCLPDDLSFGPINPPEPRVRSRWVLDELSVALGDEEWLTAATANFWTAALSTSAPRTVWFSRRGARELAGFFEFAWRLPVPSGVDVLEFDKEEVTYRWADGRTGTAMAKGLAAIQAPYFVAKRFWDRAKPLDRAAWEHYPRLWTGLRTDDAPLRIVDERGLVSAPLTHFDELLVSCASDDWRRIARVLGTAIAKIDEGPFIQPSELVLVSRIGALIDAGRLDGRGDLSQMHRSEVRLPAAVRAARS